MTSDAKAMNASSSARKTTTMTSDAKAMNVSFLRIASLVAVALLVRLALSSSSPSSSPSSLTPSPSASTFLERREEEEEGDLTTTSFASSQTNGGSRSTALTSMSPSNENPSSASTNNDDGGDEEIGYGYKVENVRTRSSGKYWSNRDLDITLKLIKPSLIYGPDIPSLNLRVRYESKERLRVHITASDGERRWEVPRTLLSMPTMKRSRGEGERGKSDRTVHNSGHIHLTRTGSAGVSQCSHQERNDRVMLGEGLARDGQGSASAEQEEEEEEDSEGSRADDEKSLTSNLSEPPLKFSYTENPFGFAITREATGQVLFNSTPGAAPTVRNMVFKDQYLELTTITSADSSLYGLGESMRPDGFRLVPNCTHTLWAADISSCNANMNLYGVHPYYLDLRKDGSAHGVLLFNSNGMDVRVNEDSIQYRVLGGVFDFFFFTGPSPAAVTDQYTQLIGRPAPMPYWAFGFHQCRYGYLNLQELEEVVHNYTSAKIPLEGMWADIDYMHGFRDFTFDPQNFPEEGMRNFINHLHRQDQRFVVIVDPGIKIDSNYSAYRRGMEANIFVKDVTGRPYVAQVWPGATHIPDFLNPRTVSYWEDEIREFRKKIEFDGLWLDMNEPANFCSGVVCSPTQNCPAPGVPPYICCLPCQGTGVTEESDSEADNVSTKWDRPPYKINSYGRHAPLGTKTLPPSARHINGILHYNAHNIYGLSQARATASALKAVMKKRSFLLSRATFPGAGAYAAHWSGDNCATWQDLTHSIAAMLNMGLFGIAMTGADICGFRGNTTEELCRRWVQLGSFYPFARDHSDTGTLHQELYRWESVAETARKHLELRYRLLPYFYTRLHEATSSGLPIVRPLFFSFAKDSTTHAIDRQFLIGKGLMVSPVLEEGAEMVNAYFPQGSWYNLQDFSCVQNVPRGSWVTLPAPQDSINVHVFEGEVLPMQHAAMTTTRARRSPFSLFVTFPAWHGPCTAYDFARVSSIITRNRTVVAPRQPCTKPSFIQTEPLLLSATAKGELYIDDDQEVVDMSVREDPKREHAAYISFDSGIWVYEGSEQSEERVGNTGGCYGKGSLQASVIMGMAFACEERWVVDRVVILGPAWAPTRLTLNGKMSRLQRDVKMEFDQALRKTHFFDMKLTLCNGFTLEWEAQW